MIVLLKMKNPRRHPVIMIEKGLDDMACQCAFQHVSMAHGFDSDSLESWLANGRSTDAYERKKFSKGKNTWTRQKLHKSLLLVSKFRKVSPISGVPAVRARSNPSVTAHTKVQTSCR